jgi:hypothetical protein
MACAIYPFRIPFESWTAWPGNPPGHATPTILSIELAKDGAEDGADAGKHVALAKKIHGRRMYEAYGRGRRAHVHIVRERLLRPPIQPGMLHRRTHGSARPSTRPAHW